MGRCEYRGAFLRPRVTPLRADDTRENVALPVEAR